MARRETRGVQRAIRIGMLVGMEETARALENRKYTEAAQLTRRAIAAHIERYPEVAEYADAKPVTA